MCACPLVRGWVYVCLSAGVVATPQQYKCDIDDAFFYLRIHVSGVSVELRDLLRSCSHYQRVTVSHSRRIVDTIQEGLTSVVEQKSSPPLFHQKRALVVCRKRRSHCDWQDVKGGSPRRISGQSTRQGTIMVWIGIHVNVCLVHGHYSRYRLRSFS